MGRQSVCLPNFWDISFVWGLLPPPETNITLLVETRNSRWAHKFAIISLSILFFTWLDDHRISFKVRVFIKRAARDISSSGAFDHIASYSAVSGVFMPTWTRCVWEAFFPQLNQFAVTSVLPEFSFNPFTSSFHQKTHRMHPDLPAHLLSPSPPL